MTTITLSPEVAALTVRGVVWAVPWEAVDSFEMATDATGLLLSDLRPLIGERVQIRADDTEPSGPLAAWWSSEADEPEIIWDTFGCNADQIHGVDAHEDETGNWWRIEWPRDQVVGSATVTAVVPIVESYEDLPDVPALIEQWDEYLNYWPEGEDEAGGDISDHLALFPEGSWTPGGQECENCCGHGVVWSYYGNHRDQCSACDGSGRTPQRWALILGEASDET